MVTEKGRVAESSHIQTDFLAPIIYSRTLAVSRTQLATPETRVLFVATTL